MLEIIYRIDPKNIQAMRSHLEDYRRYLQPDPSNYARGRKRFWFKREWDLKHKTLKPAIAIPRLESYLHRLGIPFDLGLIACGESGISWHRDDSYANFVAYTINLSAAPFDWGYQPCYPGYGWSKQQADAPRKTYRLMPGDIIKFNCKNPHATLGKDPDRWSINLWTLKDKYR